MFVFGHVGFGRTLIGPLRRALPVIPFVVGALLPDVIDKPLYYSHVSGFVTCTRTFAHTGLFVAALGVVAWVTRSPGWLAMTVGAATHPLLDTAMDMFGRPPSSALIALTWPFLHTRFYVRDFASPLDQLRQTWRLDTMITEVIGIVLIAYEYWTRAVRR